MGQSYLEKVLRHAGRKLSSEGEQKPTDLLEVYRHFLKVEEHRLRLAHKSGEGGRETCRLRAQLVTVILKDVWERACQYVATIDPAQKEPEITLTTVGGFGRGELNPFSDVDILFLYSKDGRTHYTIVEKMVEQVLYVLWDVGFKVGHAARTLPELVQEANSNLETKTSLLECAYLAGDTGLWKKFEKAFWKECLKGKEKEYLSWRVREQAERHAKYGGTVFVQEPHIKNGCGGLRDYQNLLWVAQVKRGIRSTQGLQEAKLLEAGERKQAEAAYDFILRLRTEMHLLCNRAEDRLNLELQGRVATSLRYSGNMLRRTEALMRDYYQHAHHLSSVCDTLAQRIAGWEKPKPRWAFLSRRQRYDAFILKKGELDVEDADVLRADPRRLLRAFQLIQAHDAELSPALAIRIRRRLRYLDRAFLSRRDVGEMILSLFRSKGKVGRVLRRMHQLDMLGRIFPEFSRLTCLVQHEFFHRYTADEHTLVCLEMLDRILDAQDAPFKHYRPLLQKLEKPHILYLAMLLHDTGKANNGLDHAEAGAANAMKVARRLRLPPEDAATLVFLVRHHLTMGETARRKNLDDQEAVLEFARLVQTQERLDMLMLLTFADNEGTNSSKQWSDWKELLLWQLYRRTGEALSGVTEFQEAARRQLEELEGKVASRMEDSLDSSELHAHFETLPPRYFRTTTEEGIVEHLHLINQFISRQLEPGDGLKPSISWKNFEAEGYSEVTLVSWDRERVFSKLTGAFAALGFSILSADIFTRTDNIIIDIFRFCTDRFEAAIDERDRRKFFEIVEAALSRDAYDVKELVERNRKGYRFRNGFDASSFPTRITFDQKSSSEYTLLDLQTPDRPGLLYDVAECLSDFGAQIAHARIATEKGAALDTFYLTDREGRKWPDAEALQPLAARIRGKLLPDPAAGPASC
ncbi:MAG: [protein-PII] uridylyltransferase [Verrucomicrobium sp.]|nr:[protein-PII] uridylyltransferase [Verrucomicrobium sp.]